MVASVLLLKMCGLILLADCLVCLESKYQKTNLFTGFFPCVPDTSNISTQEDAQSCDLFVYAAVQLALERVNEGSEPDQKLVILPVASRDTIEVNGLDVVFL